MADAKEVKVYVHVKSGERREFVDSVYKNLSKTLKALWLPADEVAAQALSSAKSIHPAGITVNSSNKSADEAHAVLAEVFDELGIAKPDGSILDMAITAAGALRSASAAINKAIQDSIEGAPTKAPDLTAKEEVQTKVDADGNTKRANEEKEEAKTIDDYTKAELQEALNKRGIVYGARDTKDQLLTLLKNAD
jgi:hypothetical protein